MNTTRMCIEPDFIIGEVSPHLYGSFLEHMGRAVYDGIHEPGHPEADEQGWRRDVMALTRELGVTLMRFPGGNFVSGYDWKDGIGPRERRPARLDMAWNSLECNEVGLNEFVDLCRKLQVEPMYTVNLGTLTPLDAAQIVEYCNLPSGTYWSDLRVDHGWPEPHRIRYWCLGNEMDGEWQLGNLSARDYAAKAREAARMMKIVDPSIELAVCGSSAPYLKSFPEWDRIVLEELYDQVEFLSLHQYVGNHEGDTRSYLGCSNYVDEYLRGAAAAIDYARAIRRSKKRVHISFDEWNVWYRETSGDGGRRRAPRLLEEPFNVEDALAVGLFLITLLRHADRVRIACLAQLVNVLGPIHTEPGGTAFRHTIFWPFMHAARMGRGTVLRGAVEGPTYPTEKYGVTALCEAVCLHDASADELIVFAVNRDLEREHTLEIRTRGLEVLACTAHECLTGEPKESNTVAEPNRVQPESCTDRTEPTPDGACLLLSTCSWNALRLKVARRAPALDAAPPDATPEPMASPAGGHGS